jgi:transposase
MRTHTSGIVGYNVQTAVDVKHRIIAAHEVTNEVTDRSQVMNMAALAKQAMGSEQLTVVADRGYYNGTETIR